MNRGASIGLSAGSRDVTHCDKQISQFSCDSPAERWAPSSVVHRSWTLLQPVQTPQRWPQSELKHDSNLRLACHSVQIAVVTVDSVALACSKNMAGQK